jgi:imidazole glycerol phosphate synthase subunit HisF
MELVAVPERVLETVAVPENDADTVAVFVLLPVMDEEGEGGGVSVAVLDQLRDLVAVGVFDGSGVHMVIHEVQAVVPAIARLVS